jgi:hypothetical protein
MHHHNVSHSPISFARFEPVFAKARMLSDLIGHEAYLATVKPFQTTREIEGAIDRKLTELKQEAVNG